MPVSNPAVTIEALVILRQLPIWALFKKFAALGSCSRYVYHSCEFMASQHNS